MSIPPPHSTGGALWPFAKRALVAVAIAAAAWLVWQMRYALLTVFAAVMLAVLLLAMSDLLRRLVPIGRGWALGIAVGLIVILVAGMSWMTGSHVKNQFGELWRSLPEAAMSIERRWGIEVAESIEPQAGADDAMAAESAGTEPPTPAPVGAVPADARPGAAPSEPDAQRVRSAIISRLTGWLASYGLSIVDAILGVVLVVIAGVYLAADPELYRRGTVKLFPPAEHQLVSDTMVEMGATLRWWLLGKLISMILIGVLSGLGTWLIGLPTPLALGIFAGVMEFVPIIGPIVGAVPALLLAATDSLTTVVWTLLLYLGIQQIESNIIAPNVEARMATIPPALFVLGVGLFGGLFGLLGLVLSGPLLVVSFVAVKKLWMRQALHESTPLPTDGKAP